MDILQPLPGTSFAKLQAKIKKDLGIDVVNFTRAYPGYWQRKQGAFVWFAWVLQDGHLRGDVGSAYRVDELIKANKLIMSHTDSAEIYPDK